MMRMGRGGKGRAAAAARWPAKIVLLSVLACAGFMNVGVAQAATPVNPAGRAAVKGPPSRSAADRTASSGSGTFTQNGQKQQWRVPAGVYLVKITAQGGAGGGYIGAVVDHTTYPPVAGGAAAQVTGIWSVTPGDSLVVDIGGEGTWASEGGPFPGGYSAYAPGGAGGFAPVE